MDEEVQLDANCRVLLGKVEHPMNRAAISDLSLHGMGRVMMWQNVAFMLIRHRSTMIFSADFEFKV